MVVFHLGEVWECPRHLNRPWADLQDWLLNGQDGPCWQKSRLDDLMDDLKEGGRFCDVEVEWRQDVLQDEVHIRGRSLHDGWEQFQKLIDDFAFAQARRSYSERTREEKAKSLQETMNSRLAMSLVGRKSMP